MNKYQIYVNGKATGIFYNSTSKEEALVDYASDFVNVFIDEFGTFPDMAYFDYVKAIEM